MNQRDGDVLEIRDFAENSWLNGKVRYRYLDLDHSNAEVVGHYENDRLWFKYPIDQGLMHGVCRIWHEDGRLQIEETYDRGILHGLQREWYSDGKLKLEKCYKNGLMNGDSTTWYENGDLSFQGFYAEGTPNGIIKYWYQNGILKSQEGYNHGIRHGISTRWREDGSLLSQKAYIRGVAVSVKLHKLINSGQLTAQHILKIQNIAVRRICFEEMGYERFLSQVEYEVISKEGDYELLRIDWHERDEPIYLVKVRCPSIGVFYTLRVPPTVKTIKEAIAWTFGLKEKEYNPQIET